MEAKIISSRLSVPARYAEICRMPFQSLGFHQVFCHFRPLHSTTASKWLSKVLLSPEDITRMEYKALSCHCDPFACTLLCCPNVVALGLVLCFHAWWHCTSICSSSLHPIDHINKQTVATCSHVHEGTSNRPSHPQPCLSWYRLPPALCISLRPTPFSIACPFSHCHCGDRIKPTQTSSQNDCVMKAVAGMAAMLGTRGCRTTMIPSLNRNAAEVQRIVAPAWQGLSAMPDSASSPLPPLVPDKAGGRHSNIIVDFIWGGGLHDFRAHLCYWHFLMCLM